MQGLYLWEAMYLKRLKIIADPGCFDDNPGLLIYGMTCVTISVGLWLILASWLEMPVSTTHSCVGGVIGMAMIEAIVVSFGIILEMIMEMGLQI